MIKSPENRYDNRALHICELLSRWTNFKAIWKIRSGKFSSTERAEATHRPMARVKASRDLISFIAPFSSSLERQIFFQKIRLLFLFYPRKSSDILICNLLVIFFFNVPCRNLFPSKLNGTLIFYIYFSCYLHLYLVVISPSLCLWPEKHRDCFMSILLVLWSQKQSTLEHRVQQLYTAPNWICS